MKQSEVKEMNNEKLIAALYWVAVRATNEANSHRGLTKQTSKEEEWIVTEVVKRFDLDERLTWEEIDK
jgi:hypothetical protein